MKYLIVVPAYNEEKYLKTLLQNLFTVTRDIVVVDDGSTDSTYQIAQDAGVAAIHQSHQGKGGALRAGFQYALQKGYEWVVTMDGDGQHDYQDLPRFISAIDKGENDIIVGSRMADVAQMPAIRKITNMLLSRLLSKIIGSPIADTQCGFRAIRAEVLQNVILETSHYDTESELLIKAGRRGYGIASVPVKTIYNDSQSKINKFVDTMRFLRLMWKML